MGEGEILVVWDQVGGAVATSLLLLYVFGLSSPQWEKGLEEAASTLLRAETSHGDGRKKK